MFGDSYLGRRSLGPRYINPGQCISALIYSAPPLHNSPPVGRSARSAGRWEPLSCRFHSPFRPFPSFVRPGLDRNGNMVEGGRRVVPIAGVERRPRGAGDRAAGSPTARHASWRVDRNPLALKTGSLIYPRLVGWLSPRSGAEMENVHLGIPGRTLGWHFPLGRRSWLGSKVATDDHLEPSCVYIWADVCS